MRLSAFVRAVRCGPAHAAFVLASAAVGCGGSSESTETTSPPHDAAAEVASDAGDAVSDGLECSGCSVVCFEDPALEAAVRETLGGVTGPLLGKDVATLDYVPAEKRGVEKLGGIECAVNLTALSLIDNSVSDLGPLAGLAKLHTLYLDGNPVSSLEPLSGVATLEVLTARDAELADLAPLAGHSKLRSLIVPDNAIVSLEPLAELPITKLSVRGNPVESLVPISKIVTLDELEVDATGAADLAALATLPKLTHLSAESNQIVDVAPLAAMASLHVAKLTSNRVADLAPLLTAKVFELWIEQNPLSAASKETVIPQLCAKGFIVHFDGGVCGTPSP